MGKVMIIESFEDEFKDHLTGFNYLTVKKIEYEFNRWKNGLGRKLKLSENEILALNYIKEKARKR
jgi:hypothetical protein|nr:MAG TPA: hypothetical protein [Caudoviricetes sp.]